jgi:hypothetical protein
VAPLVPNVTTLGHSAISVVMGHEQKPLRNGRPSEAALDQRSIIAFIFCRAIGGHPESICLAHRGPKKDQRGGEAERGAPRMQSGPFLD